MKPDFAEIKRTTDLVRVIESYGVALRKAGADHVGLCPFHEDRKPSLHVTAAKGLWRCPACGVAGNVIQFVARIEQLTEREAALKLLGNVPGVQRASALPGRGGGRESRGMDDGRAAADAAPVAQIDDATRAKLLARVASFYAKTLTKDRAGLDYLKARRLDEPAMLETFAVGYCNGSLRGALPRAGEIVEQLKALGVLNERGNEVMFGRVVVPIHDAAGNVCGLYGRRVGSEEPRHLYLRGERRGVFNAQAAKGGEGLILVESILDALSLWSAGFHNAVALYGADGWTPDHAELIRANAVRECYLALDGDEAGAAGAARLAPILAELGVAVHRLAWPDGVKDANDFFSSRSSEDFAALLKAANPASEQRSETAERLGSEDIEPTADGFAAAYGEGAAARRYELCAIDKPSPSRLKATVRALAGASGGAGAPRFVIDTLDFFSMRSKRSFIAEAGRMFRESVEVIEADVNRLTLAAENFVALRAGGGAAAPAAASDAERSEGMKLARSADLIGELQRDLDRLGIIGERTNRLLLYLAMTSRKMEEPLAVQILSSSGAGKSHLQDAVLSLCPDEDLIKLTSLTDRALFYKGEDSLRHKAIAIAEVAGAEGARYALRNLISDRKLVIESTIKNPLTGRLETQVNTVHGPTAVFETTTNPDTDAETKSRYLLLSVDESPEQTRAILDAQRQSHTLDGRKRRAARAAVLARQHAFQRMLRPLCVINPFEPLLAYGDGRLLFRRDHPKYLNLILAVTFLHQHQRAVKHDAELGDYIETTLDDIAIANELAADLFGQSLDELSFPSRELLRLIVDYVEQRAAQEKQPAAEIEFSRRDLREALQWSEYQLRTHLRQLAEMQYLVPLCGRQGALYSYRLVYRPGDGGGFAADGRRFAPGLKTIEQLRQDAAAIGLAIAKTSRAGDELRGSKTNFEGTSLKPAHEVTPPGNPHEHSNGEPLPPTSRAVNGKRIYTLRTNGARRVVSSEAAATAEVAEGTREVGHGRTGEGK